MRAQLQRLDGTQNPPLLSGTDLPSKIRISNIMLSQSGSAFPKDYAGRDEKPILPPGLEGQIEQLMVTAISPSGTRTTNTFGIGPDGHLKPNASPRPLGHVPYELALIGKDGARYVANVDISPSKAGTTTPGYLDLGAVDFVREAAPTPPAPPPPAEVKLGDFMLSQSGSAFPVKYGEKNAPPLLPNNDGAFVSMVVTALSPSRTRTSNTFPIDASGHLHPQASTRPLGHVPYEITLVGKDGSRYSGVVDISPSKVGTMTPGYLDITGLVLKRETDRSVGSAAPLNDADSAFLQGGGAAKQKPTIAASPVGIYFQNRAG